MESTYKCALQGFSEPEHSSFVVFLRMTVNLGVAFEYVADCAAAHVVIVNADAIGSSDQLKNAVIPPKALFIGDVSPDPKLPCLPRPIRLTKVLQALQRLVTGWPGAAPPAMPAPAAIRAPLPAAPAPAATIAGPAATATKVGAHALATSILVVDDSDIALKFMRSRLERFGFRVDLVQSGEEAMVSAREHAYDLVFIDVMMDGIDGYQTCKLIKQRRHNGRKPPLAVMLTSRGGTIDKLRGSLAGCDAYLTKPITETDLMGVLIKHSLI